MSILWHITKGQGINNYEGSLSSKEVIRHSKPRDVAVVNQYWPIRKLDSSRHTGQSERLNHGVTGQSESLIHGTAGQSENLIHGTAGQSEGFKLH